MKLPENKKERIQYLVLFGIVGVAVLYLAVSAGIKPMLQYKKESRARVEELNEDIRKADLKIRNIQTDLAKNTEVLAQICDETDAHILRSELETAVTANYLDVAKTIINRVAGTAQVPLESISEAGISEVPQNPARPTKNILRSYGIRISMKGGYTDLIRLLNAIEASNPYLCVTELTISGQGATEPEIHRISFKVEWPIWADEATPGNLKQQLAEARKPGASQ